MNILEDQLLKNLIVRKNVSYGRKRVYAIVLTDMYSISGLTPSELINEAKEDETPYIKNDRIKFKEINERKITRYFYEYYALLQNRDVSNNSIKQYMSTLRSFYTEYNIQLPKPIQIEISKPIIKKGDIPDINDIRKSLEITNSLRNKAIILFLATTGIRGGDLRDFKIKDLLEATKSYYDSLDELLKVKHCNNVIPTWYFIPNKTKKLGNICVTFNTPEATEAIINYLKSRKNISLNDYLFSTRNNKRISKYTFLKIFRDINDKIFHRDEKGNRFFHAHALRKFFISTCNHNSGDLAKVNLLSGHSNKSNVHDTYNEVNTEVMKRFYTKLIPYLSIRDTKVHDIKPAELVKIEKEKEELKENLSKTDERLAKLEAKEEKRQKVDTIVDNMTDEQLEKMLEFLKK